MGWIIIDDIQDVKRVSNNLYFFWKSRPDWLALLSELSRSNSTFDIASLEPWNSEEEGIIDEIKSYEKAIIKIIDNNLAYIEEHDDEIFKQLSEVRYNNLKIGMKWMRILAEMLVQKY